MFEEDGKWVCRPSDYKLSQHAYRSRLTDPLWDPASGHFGVPLEYFTCMGHFKTGFDDNAALLQPLKLAFVRHLRKEYNRASYMAARRKFVLQRKVEKY